MARAHIPFFQQVPLKMSRASIEALATTYQNKVEAGFSQIQAFIRHLGGRSEIAGYEAHDVYLESFGQNDFVIYSSSLLSSRQTNWSDAIHVAHHILHFPIIANRHGIAGMQVLTSSGRKAVTGSEETNDTLDLASHEAIWFAAELFMPKEEFVSCYNEHGFQNLFTFYNFPKRVVELRAKRLGIKIPTPEEIDA